MCQGRIGVDGQLLHPLPSQYGGGKIILQASIIEVRIINARASLAIFLRDDHDIEQPLGVLSLFDEASGNDFVHFLFYDSLQS